MNDNSNVVSSTQIEQVETTATINNVEEKIKERNKKFKQIVDNAIVDEMFVYPGHYFLVADSGTGKTTFATYLRYCVLNGYPFLGNKTTASKVGYISLELTEDDYAFKFLNPYKAKTFLQNMSEEDLNSKSPYIFLSPKKRNEEYLKNKIKELADCGCRLIIVDMLTYLNQFKYWCQNDSIMLEKIADLNNLAASLNVVLLSLGETTKDGFNYKGSAELKAPLCGMWLLLRKDSTISEVELLCLKNRYDKMTNYVMSFNNDLTYTILKTASINLDYTLTTILNHCYENIWEKGKYPMKMTSDDKRFKEVEILDISTAFKPSDGMGKVKMRKYLQIKEKTDILKNNGLDISVKFDRHTKKWSVIISFDNDTSDESESQEIIALKQQVADLKKELSKKGEGTQMQLVSSPEGKLIAGVPVEGSSTEYEISDDALPF